MIRILLLGAGSSPSVNFIRALRLSKKKYFIVGVEPNKYFLEMTPADKRYIKPPLSEKEYTQRLCRLVKKEKIDFVHPQQDREVKIISQFRHLFKGKIMIPSTRGVRNAQDKWKTYQCLKENNIPVAETIQIKNPRSLTDFIRRQKETVWIRAKTGVGGRASLPVEQANHGKMWISYWISKGMKMTEFLASEYLPGKEISWLSLWKDGTLICSQQKERYEWVQASISPSNVGGTTAIQKTVSYNEINMLAVKTIRAIDPMPNGIYVVDAKQNRNGVYCVTEINAGRFFTTSLFFATAGVNFPEIYVRLGLNLPIKNIVQENCLPDDIYWIRVPDGGPTMVKGETWSSRTI